MKPDIIPRPGGWEYRWNDIALRLERIRESRDTLSAELTVQYLPQGEEGYLLIGARPNLMSLTAPGSLEKRLKTRMNGVDWSDYIEKAFALTIRQYRASAEPVIIGNRPLHQRPKWRLEPFLLDRHVTCLYGHGGSGKSTLAAWLAICIQLGVGQDLGLHPESGNVAILDYESSEEDWNEVCKQMEAGMGLLEPVQILYRRSKPPLTGDIEEIQTLVKQKDIKCLIVDSAIRACGGEKEAKENAAPMIDALAGLGISVLLISHLSKAELGSKAERTPFASIFFWNGPRMVWELRQEKQDEPDTIDMALFNRKSNYPRLYTPLGYRITFSDLGIAIAKRDIRKMTDASAALPLTNRITYELEIAPASVKELAKSLDVPENSIRTILNRHKQMFVKIDDERDGRWGLLSSEES